MIVEESCCEFAAARIYVCKAGWGGAYGGVGGRLKAAANRRETVPIEQPRTAAKPCL